MFLDNKELELLGLKSFGENVLISKKASIYNAANISLGSNVRIDDFAILSAGVDGIEIGSYVHIGSHSTIIGKAKIIFEDFTGLSIRVSVFSSSDDFLGEGLTNPTVPSEFRATVNARVHFKKHSGVGAHSVVLPGVTLEEGAAVGANSLVRTSLESWAVYFGSPARKISKRAKLVLEKEKMFNLSLK